MPNEFLFIRASWSGILIPMSQTSLSIPDSLDDTTGFVLDNRWTIRPDINRIYDGEIEHQVPDKFMHVLVVLARSPGVVSRQELFDAVWPDTIVVDESLTRAISSLRKLFNDDPKSPRVIQTIPKKGYRIVAPIKPITSPETTRSTPAGRGTDRPDRNLNRWIGAAVVIAAVLIGAWFTIGIREPQPGEADQIHLTAMPGIEEYPALSPAGDRFAFVWDGNDAEPDGVYVQVIGAGTPLRLTHAEGHYAFPVWTHDSRFIAFARLAGASRGIFMVPATGGAEIKVVTAEHGSMLNSPAFSPDGRWLVFARRDSAGVEWRLQRMNLATESVDTLAPSPGIPYGGYRPRFSPDGRHLAFIPIDDDHRRVMISTIEGTPPRAVQIGDLPLTDFDWAPGGDALIVSGGGRIRLVGLDGSAGRIFSSPQSVGALSAALDRSVVAFSAGRREKNIWRWTPSTDLSGETSTRIIHSTAWDACPSISPDGRTIAFLTSRTGAPELWLALRDGSGAHKIAEVHGVRWAPPAWSPHGDRVALTEEVDGIPATLIVEIASGRTRLLPPLDGGETHPSWSRDGTTLLVTRDTLKGGEIWRRGLSDGAASNEIVIAEGGGFRAFETSDGEGLLFTRGRRGREIWQSGPEGENPEVVFSLLEGEILTWRVTDDGIHIGYRRQIDDQIYSIVFFDFESQETTELLDIPGKLGFDLDVDPMDTRSIVFDQTEAVDSDIFAIENY